MEGEVDKCSQYSTHKCPIKSLSILVVDDDTTCLSIVAAILKSWKYKVVTVKHPNDALHTLRIKGVSFDLVISDVHMPDMNGFELQKQIDEEFKLPVILMSADDKDGMMIKGLQNGAVFFIVKPISPNDLKNLWQYAIANRKGKVIIEEIEDTQEAPEHENPHNKNISIVESISQIVSSSSEANEFEIKASAKGKKEDNKVVVAKPKKGKFVWTTSLHNQFLEAIKSLGGLDRAVPKKIVETMNVPGLTRENIASHLQKYRIFVKKVSEPSSQIEVLHRSTAASTQPLGLNYKRTSFQRSFPTLMSTKQEFRNSSSNYSALGFGDSLSSLLYKTNTSNSRQLQLINPKSPYQAYDSVLGKNQQTKYSSYGDFSNGLFISEEKSLMSRKYCIYDDSTRLMQPKIESAKSIYPELKTNHPKFPFYGKFTKEVVLSPEISQIAEKYLNKRSNIDVTCYEKIGSFNHPKDLNPNYGTSKIMGFEGLNTFVSKNVRKNEMENENQYVSTMPEFGGSFSEGLAHLGGSSLNKPTFELRSQSPKSSSNEDDYIFGQLTDLLDSNNNYFLREFGDDGDVSFAMMNQTATPPATQKDNKENLTSVFPSTVGDVPPVTQQPGGEELIPNFGITGSPSDQFFQSSDTNSCQFDDDETLELLFSGGEDGLDRNSRAL